MVLACHAVAIGYPSGTGNALAIGYPSGIENAVAIGYPSGTGNALAITLELVGLPLGTDNELINNLAGEANLSRLCQGVPRRE